MRVLKFRNKKMALMIASPNRRHMYHAKDVNIHRIVGIKYRIKE